MLTKINNFFQRDIWRIRVKALPRKKSFFIKQLRVFVLAIREFYGNKRQLSASALTFYSLLSIVPVVAMAFGIAKGFGFEKILEKQILGRFPGHEETLGQVIGFANNLLERTRGGLIAGIGVVILFWTVVKILDSIEGSFNDIWGIRKGRAFARKVSDYLSVMLICPFLLILSSGITIFVRTQLQALLQNVAALAHFSGLLSVGLNILPYAMIWALFTFIYIFMPNTKVNFKSGLLGGIVAGTIYQAVQSVYITFQVGVGKANAIYGSFAALPLFLIWLQLSWRIILFGAEVVFAHQNVDTYEFEHDCLNASHSFKKLLALHVASVLVKRFAAGAPALTAAEISDSLDIPIRLAREILFDLSETGIISEIRSPEYKQVSFQPAQDINRLTIFFVIKALENKGVCDIPVARTQELQKLSESLKSFEEAIVKSPANKLLKDI